MKKTCFLAILGAILLTGLYGPAAEARSVQRDAEAARPQTPRFGLPYAVGGYPVIMYIPNRIFDLLDIVRLRVRVGPGLSAGVRATEVADLFVGSHATVYAGLRGSRGTPEIPWPIGLEKNEGFEISIADVTDEDKNAPCVDPLEISLQAQALAAGVYVGIEIFEILDFVTGILFLDLQGDDF